MCILDICISSLLQCLFNILFPVGAIPGRIVFFFKLFIYLLLTVLGLHCYRLFSSCSKQGLLQLQYGDYSLVAVYRLLIEVASLIMGHRLQGVWALVVVACGLSGMAPRLQNTGSVVVAHRPSFSAACGIFPDQGSNPCQLHWQADWSPLSHQRIVFLMSVLIINCQCIGIKLTFSLLTKLLIMVCFGI